MLLAADPARGMVRDSDLRDVRTDSGMPQHAGTGGPLPGHVLVDMVASAITHGDKFFLTRPCPDRRRPTARHLRSERGGRCDGGR